MVYHNDPKETFTSTLKLLNNWFCAMYIKNNKKKCNIPFNLEGVVHMLDFLKLINFMLLLYYLLLSQRWLTGYKVSL